MCRAACITEYDVAACSYEAWYSMFLSVGALLARDFAFRFTVPAELSCAHLANDNGVCISLQAATWHLPSWCSQ